MIEIVLLTQDDCVFCDRAKEILGRLTLEFALSVVDVDVRTAKGQAFVESSGLPFAPGLFVDGALVFYGRLSERRLRRELERLRSDRVG